MDSLLGKALLWVFVEVQDVRGFVWGVQSFKGLLKAMWYRPQVQGPHRRPQQTIDLITGVQKRDPLFYSNPDLAISLQSWMGRCPDRDPFLLNSGCNQHSRYHSVPFQRFLRGSGSARGSSNPNALDIYARNPTGTPFQEAPQVRHQDVESAWAQGPRHQPIHPTSHL